MAVDIEALITQINSLPAPQRLRVLAEVSAGMARESRHDELVRLSERAGSELTLDQMAAKQGVAAPCSFEELKSRAWPEDEPKDAFLDWLGEQRQGPSHLAPGCVERGVGVALRDSLGDRKRQGL